MSDEIRVLVVDDNPMMRVGLVQSISIEPGLTIVGEAANGEEAIELVRELRPDVITMDYQMPGDNGLEVTAKIINEFPEARIILLTVFDSEEDILNAVRAGVKGYLTKKTGGIKVMVEALHAVAEGKTYFQEGIAHKLKERQNQQDLTKREMEILKLLANGFANKEMAAELNISDATVKLHLSNLREKLGAIDRTQAVVFAYKKGILHLDD